MPECMHHIYIYILTCRHVNVETCKHADMQTHMHLCVCACVHANIHAYMRTMHTCEHAYTRRCMNMLTYTYMLPMYTQELVLISNKLVLDHRICICFMYYRHTVPDQARCLHTACSCRSCFKEHGIRRNVVFPGRNVWSCRDFQLSFKTEAPQLSLLFFFRGCNYATSVWRMTVFTTWGLSVFTCSCENLTTRKKYKSNRPKNIVFYRAVLLEFGLI